MKIFYRRPVHKGGFIPQGGRGANWKPGRTETHKPRWASDHQTQGLASLGRKGEGIGEFMGKETRVRITVHMGSMRESGWMDTRTGKTGVFLLLTNVTTLVMSCLPYKTKD